MKFCRGSTANVEALASLFQHVFWWQIRCTVLAVSVIYLYLAFSVPQPLHGAFPAVGMEQHHGGTDKSCAASAALAVCAHESCLLSSADHSLGASPSFHSCFPHVLHADGPSCCSQLGGIHVPSVRNCQVHMLRGYIFSYRPWNISGTIQTWM